MHKNYQGKVQAKVDHQINKHKNKNKLKHSQEISRINEDRRRKMEREIAGYSKPDQAGRWTHQTKYFVLGAVCLGVMLFCGFWLLQRKVEREQVEGSAL